MVSEKIGEQQIIAELGADGLSKRRRRAQLLKLQQMGTERSIDVLRENLLSTDVKSQVRAVFALAHIGTAQAVDALIDSLAVTTGPGFTFAVKSLAEDHAARARPAFVRMLEERHDELRQGDKQVLVWALYQTPHRSEVPVLAALLGERSRSTRRMAAVALGQIRASESREALEEAVKSLPWLRGLSARRALRSQRNAAGE
jgi:HEAT repeat protein